MSTIKLEHIPKGSIAALLLAILLLLLYRRFGGTIQVIYRDFRCGKFYKPWKSSTPFVLVSSKEQIAEFCEVSSLSQRAVYADMFGFKHTMENFEHNRINHTVVRNRFNKRLLELKGPAHLEALYPNFLTRFENSWIKALEESGRVGGSGTISLPAAKTCRRLSTRMISLIFFGEKLTSNEKFIEALLQYSRDMINCMIAFQVLPSSLSPYTHWMITRGGKAMSTLTKQFSEVLGPGIERWDEAEHIKRHTIIYNMVSQGAETENYWTGPELHGQIMLGLWFAASHQPWINLNVILLEVCARRDWQERLRQEIKEHEPLDTYKKLDGLPLLDSFMKETLRLNPLDTLGIRRKALQPYTFANGKLSAPQGATVCVPAYEMLHDASNYPNPNDFDGARFVPDHGKEQKQRKFTQVSHDYPMWGYGSLACPGRFHAALVIKVVLSKLIMRYDLSLENEDARRKWQWETFMIPYESTRIILKERESC